MASEKEQTIRHPLELLEEDKRFVGLSHSQQIATIGFMTIMINDARARILKRGEPEDHGAIEVRVAVLKVMGIPKDLISFVSDAADSYNQALKEKGPYYYVK